MSHLRFIRSLASTYQAFEAYSTKHIKKTGLTMTQFDVIATLGNQPPMTCKELGEKTLILKGTMTGVLERLELKGFIQKIPNVEDGRSYRIGLTKTGDRLFKKVFTDHVKHLESGFAKCSNKELDQMIGALDRICIQLNQAKS